jgi:hypothetical protein
MLTAEGILGKSVGKAQPHQQLWAAVALQPFRGVKANQVEVSELKISKASVAVCAS